MSDLTTLTTLLGWCTVINLGLLIFSTIMLVSMRPVIRKIHSRLFGVDPERLDALYLNFLGNYKLAIFIFNLTPWIALKIMAQV